jgi:hypothetical protein
MNRWGGPTSAARPGRACLVIAAALSLSACASIRKNEATYKTDFLNRAGFTVMADQAAAKRRLAAMPPLRLVQQDQDGQPTYAFADPYACQCVYVGDAAAYARYRRLIEEHYLDTITSISLTD